jgi:hypothetical protein
LQNSTDTLERLEHAFDNIKRRLFSELHSVVRKQIFPSQADGEASSHLQLPPTSTPDNTSHVPAADNGQAADQQGDVAPPR